jgi:hypothetical protein
MANPFLETEEMITNVEAFAKEARFANPYYDMDKSIFWTNMAQRFFDKVVVQKYRDKTETPGMINILFPLAREVDDLKPKEHFCIVMVRHQEAVNGYSYETRLYRDGKVVYRSEAYVE